MKPLPPSVMGKSEVGQNLSLRLRIRRNRRPHSQSMHYPPLVPDEHSSRLPLLARHVHRNHMYEKVEEEFVDIQALQTAEGDVCWFYGVIVGDNPRGVIDIARLVSHVCESVVHRRTERSYFQHYVV